MSNMTGLGRYQKGLELEKEGLTGAQIAAKLGYSNVQAWYDAKQYYGKKQEAFNARAAETGSKTLPKQEVVSGELGKATSSGADAAPKPRQKPQFAPAAVAVDDLAAETLAWDKQKPASHVKKKEITLECSIMNYRYGSEGLVYIENRFSENGGIVVANHQVREWLEELMEAFDELRFKP